MNMYNIQTVLRIGIEPCTRRCRLMCRLCPFSISRVHVAPPPVSIRIGLRRRWFAHRNAECVFVCVCTLYTCMFAD